jgi:hypothetical protein
LSLKVRNNEIEQGKGIVVNNRESNAISIFGGIAMALLAQSCWAAGSLPADSGGTAMILAAKGADEELPAGRDALFDDEDESARPAAKSAEKQSGGIKGYLQFELARTTETPVHWSKMRTRAEFGSQGSFGDGLKWKASARADYDFVFDHTNYYPAEVAHDQRSNFMLRETYLDASAGDWDFRLGRQHVVWGEMIGMFFADVVSARDMREFILPDFDSMRTPQWAARAEYFKDDFHAELLWIPVATYDDIGKPGAEFYPYQPTFGLNPIYRNEVRPSNSLDHGNYGARMSILKNGWDVSGFYYRSMDIQPTFYRQIVGPNVIFEARHDRIEQVGGTVAKDLDFAVLKGETVYTRGRQFAVLDATDADGLVRQNTLDWAVGLDFTLPADTRFNVQVFERVFFDHNPYIISDKQEDGYSLYLNKKFGGKWEAQATWIASLNRTDWLFRPRVQWNFEKNWRLLVGADIFKGPPLGLFGQYSSRDRVYSEVRYSF